MSQGRTVKVRCSYCRKFFQKAVGAYNVAQRIGAPLYCTRKCAGFGRRKNRSAREKKRLKAEYDLKRRTELAEELKAKKKAAYAIWGPLHREEERKKRKERMPKHVEYCRQPEYKVYKSEYDKKRKLSRFGPFAEAYKVLDQLKQEIKKQMPDRFERYAQSGRQQWNPTNQQRRRRARTTGIDS